MTTFTTLTANCADLLDGLAKSPTFAMSRGAKELFHTNFLAFILEFDPDASSPIERDTITAVQRELINLLFGEGNAPARVLAWRERKSIDLIVCAAPVLGKNVPSLEVGEPFQFARQTPRAGAWRFDAGLAAVVLEAKLKSIPGSAQLMRYSAAIGKGINLEFADPIELRSNDQQGTQLWGSLAIRAARDQQNSEDGRMAVEFRAYDSAPQASLDDTDPNANENATGEGRKGSRMIGGAKGNLRKILLAPKDTGAAAAHAGWTHLSWRDLLAAFPDGEEGSQAAGGLLVELLRDYRHSTSMVIDILEKVEDATAAFAAMGCGEQFSALVKATMDPAFRQKRIHDLVGKFAFDLLRFRLAESINPTAVVPGFHFRSEAFMTNATPGAIFEYVLNTVDNKNKTRSVQIGVQIQGTKYRHFVSATHPADRDEDSLEKLANLLGRPDDLKSWWKVDNGENPIQNQNTGFSCYNRNAFLYTAADVSSLTYDGLKKLLISSCDRARGALSSANFLESANSLHLAKDGADEST